VRMAIERDGFIKTEKKAVDRPRPGAMAAMMGLMSVMRGPRRWIG
jgi:hypothetical protein